MDSSTPPPSVRRHSTASVAPLNPFGGSSPSLSSDESSGTGDSRTRRLPTTSTTIPDSPNVDDDDDHVEASHRNSRFLSTPSSPACVAPAPRSASPPSLHDLLGRGDLQTDVSPHSPNRGGESSLRAHSSPYIAPAFTDEDVEEWTPSPSPSSSLLASGTLASLSSGRHLPVISNGTTTTIPKSKNARHHRQTRNPPSLSSVSPEISDSPLVHRHHHRSSVRRKRREPLHSEFVEEHRQRVKRRDTVRKMINSDLLSDNLDDNVLEHVLDAGHLYTLVPAPLDRKASLAKRTSSLDLLSLSDEVRGGHLGKEICAGKEEEDMVATSSGSYDDSGGEPAGETIEMEQSVELEDDESVYLSTTPTLKPVSTSLVDDDSNELPSSLTNAVERSSSSTSRRRLPHWFRSDEVLQQNALRETKLRSNLKQQLRESATPSSLPSSLVVSPPSPLSSPLPAPYKELSVPPLSGRVICFDVETSGFGPLDCIIEIGAVEIVERRRTGRLFQTYIQPRTSINPHAFKVHKISKSMLRFAPESKFAIANFMEWVGESPLVAHNAAFDMRLLEQDLVYLDPQLSLRNQSVFCTLHYYRQTRPRGVPSALVDLANVFAAATLTRSQARHSALVDAEILADVFLSVVREVDAKSKLKTTPSVASPPVPDP